MAKAIHKLLINADTQLVYNLIKDRQGVSKWWTTDSSTESTEPLIYKFSFSTGTFNKMEVLEVEEEKSIKWKCIDGNKEWIGTDISFRLEQRESKTLLHFEHSNRQPPISYNVHLRHQVPLLKLLHPLLLSPKVGRPRKWCLAL